jgi:hypothetical protein|tara:strand:- start:2200 stop:2682 length:483 start_codon:yes stop_codon:yes gene_type:complete
MPLTEISGQWVKPKTEYTHQVIKKLLTGDCYCIFEGTEEECLAFKKRNKSLFNRYIVSEHIHYDKSNEKSNEKIMKWEAMYYIRNEGFLGNALMWWKEGRDGYTCDINKAHKFTKEEAENICKRPEDTAYKCDYIDGLLEAKKLIIDCQYVDEDNRLWCN